MKKLSLTKIAFLQAAGLIAYIVIFATTVQYLGHRFESVPIPPVFSMILALTAFVFSASVCATIFFGYPVYLFADGNKKDAIRIILQSIAWLFGFAILFLIAFVVFALFIS